MELTWDEYITWLGNDKKVDREAGHWLYFTDGSRALIEEDERGGCSTCGHGSVTVKTVTVED